MRQTKDIIKDWLANDLDLSAKVLSVTYDAVEDLSTVVFDDSLHLREKMKFTHGVDEYVVRSSNSSINSVEVDGDLTGLIGETVQIQPLFFVHGTPILVIQEIDGKVPSDKYPLCWLSEPISEVDNGVNEAIDRSAEVLMFFLDSANSPQWLTYQHYDNVLYGLNKLYERFKRDIRLASCCLVQENEPIRRVNRANWGVYANEKGYISKIMNDAVSGIELSFTLSIRDC